MTRRHRKKLVSPATPDDRRRRVAEPIVAFLCPECSWLIIESGRPRRHPCPKCAVKKMLSFGGANLDEMVSRLAEGGGFPDVAATRRRVAVALERFDERKDDWSLAEEIASRVAVSEEPARALVAHVYKGIREKARKKRAKKPGRGGKGGQKKETLKETSARVLKKVAAKLDRKKPAPRRGSFDDLAARKGKR